MTLVKSSVLVIIGAATLLLLTGCHTVSSSHTQYVGAQKFPPSDPMRVQILRAEPTRPHTRVGEVKVTTSSENVEVHKIETALKKEAATLGADAAVVVYDRTQVVGAQVVGGWLNRSIDPIEGRVAVAVAIKYQ
jgi:hypothetical protein